MNYLLTEAECNAALTRIISEFGDGRVGADRYIFAAITRLSPGFSECRLTTSELISKLSHYANVLIVFDPDTRNTPFRLHLLHTLGMDEDILGLKLATSELPKLLASCDCDFYILDLEGALLSVASHEDELLKGQRVLWSPVPIANSQLNSSESKK
jgi:hypothetical protein